MSYNWDNHDMISACNSDGYRVNFSYCQNPKRLSGIKEYGTAGTKGTDISIEYTPYQTKYINNNTCDTETKSFDRKGNLISSFNSKGDVSLNEYSKNASGLNSLVNHMSIQFGTIIYWKTESSKTVCRDGQCQVIQI